MVLLELEEDAAAHSWADIGKVVCFQHNGRVDHSPEQLPYILDDNFPVEHDSEVDKLDRSEAEIVVQRGVVDNRLGFEALVLKEVHTQNGAAAVEQK